jgi:hypothetical protein
MIELEHRLELVGQCRTLIDQAAAIANQLSQFQRERILGHELRQQLLLAANQLASQPTVQFTYKGRLWARLSRSFAYQISGSGGAYSPLAPALGP